MAVGEKRMCPSDTGMCNTVGPHCKAQVNSSLLTWFLTETPSSFAFVPRDCFAYYDPDSNIKKKGDWTLCVLRRSCKEKDNRGGEVDADLSS